MSAQNFREGFHKNGGEAFEELEEKREKQGTHHSLGQVLPVNKDVDRVQMRTRTAVERDLVHDLPLCVCQHARPYRLGEGAALPCRTSSMSWPSLFWNVQLSRIRWSTVALPSNAVSIAFPKSSMSEHRVSHALGDASAEGLRKGRRKPRVPIEKLSTGGTAPTLKREAACSIVPSPPSVTMRSIGSASGPADLGSARAVHEGDSCVPGRHITVPSGLSGLSSWNTRTSGCFSCI